MSHSPATPEQSTPRKTTLYCFDCSHEGLLAEDWVVEAGGDGTDLVCPDCGTTVLSQGQGGESAGTVEGCRCECAAD